MGIRELASYGKLVSLEDSMDSQPMMRAINSLPAVLSHSRSPKG